MRRRHRSAHQRRAGSCWPRPCRTRGSRERAWPRRERWPPAVVANAANSNPRSPLDRRVLPPARSVHVHSAGSQLVVLRRSTQRRRVHRRGENHGRRCGPDAGWPSHRATPRASSSARADRVSCQLGTSSTVCASLTERAAAGLPVSHRFSPSRRTQSPGGTDAPGTGGSRTGPIRLWRGRRTRRASRSPRRWLLPTACPRSGRTLP